MTTWMNSAKVDNGGAPSTLAPRQQGVRQAQIDAIANRVGTFAGGRSWTPQSSCSPPRATAARGWLRSAIGWV